MGLDRKRLLAYAAVAIVVLAVGVRYLLAQHSPAGASGQGVVLTQSGAAGSSGLPASTSGGQSPGAAAPASPSAAPELVVDVCGAVARPGVYHLPDGARVCDLITAAGGAAPGAEMAGVNLAAKLADGQQVVVPKKGQAAVAGGAGSASSGAAGSAAPVNLNTASLEQLDALPGVGPSTAQKIIDYRTANGSFHSVDDLKNVSGIGDAKFQALKDLVTV